MYSMYEQSINHDVARGVTAARINSQNEGCYKGFGRRGEGANANATIIIGFDVCCVLWVVFGDGDRDARSACGLWIQ